MVHQIVVTAIPIIARSGVPRTGDGSSAPSRVWNEFQSPVVGVKMKNQMRLIAADGRMNGTKNASRNSHCPRRTRLASTAKTKASRTSGGTVYSVNWMVCHIASQNSALVSIST